MGKRFVLGLAVCFVSFASQAWAAEEPLVVPLWANGAPGFEDRKDEPEEAQDYWVKNIHNPSLTVYLPKGKSTGAAVIVAPGGGHSKLVIGPEGREPAEFLNKLGVAVFVLKYRLAREENSPYKIAVHAKEDAYRAMRLVRSRADEWHIDPHRVGMLGFSAGGEVVSLVAYGFGEGDPIADDPIDRFNGRPDFQALVYPGPLGIPDEVPPDAPPAFLIVANDDKGHVEPVVKLLNEYRAAGAPVEAIIYSHGGHAFNMGTRSQLETFRHWPDRLADWMTDNGILEAGHRPEK